MKVIAGPCVIEGESWFIDWAGKLSEFFADYPVEWILKGSFDKANRTSADGYRGISRLQALQALARTQYEYGCTVTTDVHEPNQCEEVSVYVDILQIPAFLGRQTSLLQAAASTGKIVNIKKPQWMTGAECGSIVDKAKGAKEIWITHRGNHYGPGSLVVDPLDFWGMSAHSKTVILDITHTNHKLGLNSYWLAKIAKACDLEGIFAELHPSPKNAKCDAEFQLSLDEFKPIIEELVS